MFGTVVSAIGYCLTSKMSIMRERNRGGQNQQEQGNERGSLNQNYEQTSTSNQQQQQRGGSSQQSQQGRSGSLGEQSERGSFERGRMSESEPESI
jgi:hypothetical protein